MTSSLMPPFFVVLLIYVDSGLATLHQGTQASPFIVLLACITKSSHLVSCYLVFGQVCDRKWKTSWIPGKNLVLVFINELG